MSSPNILEDPALHPTMFWYSHKCYDVFEQVGQEAAQQIAEQASAISSENPLFQRDKKNQFPQFDLPPFGEVSGPFVATVMSAYLVWATREIGDQDVNSVMIQACQDGYKAWEMLRGV